MRRLVTLAEPPGDGFVAALDAAWQRGDAVLPLDPAAPAAVTDRLLAALRPDLPVDDDVTLVIATSGSTGEPKGAQLGADALSASAAATARRLGVDSGDHWLSCLPWHHIGGLQVLLRARASGLPLTVLDRFDVDSVAAVTGATLVSLVPTQLVRLLDAGVDLTGFKAVLLGGSAAPPGLLDRARSQGAPVVTTYGMSETSGGCVYDGRPLDGVEVDVDADGRVRLRGPVLFSGYRLRPDLTSASVRDGWLVTNDLGALDEAGRLRLLGRADDVVVTGGEKVVATQVAETLLGHPAVADAAVTGVPDQEWGERVVAVVVASGPPPALAELRAWCADRMPAAAAPRALVLVDEIPRLATGKPDRLAVRQLAASARG